MLDTWPPILRHAAILVGGALLTWAVQDLAPVAGPWLAAHQPWGPLAGALLAQLVLVLTPVQRAYGAGSRGAHAADRGAVRPGAVLPVVALVAVVLLTVTAAAPAGADRGGRRDPLWVGVRSACERTGVLEVEYGTERLAGGTWVVVPDSWGAAVQVHHVGAAAGPGGRWDDVPSTYRVEGLAAADVAGGQAWDLVRVRMVVDGVAVASSGRVAQECAA
jgi:hypothetical protein